MKDVQFRFSLGVMSDQYKDLILEQIDLLRSSDLNIESDDVSSLIEGDLEHVFKALHQLIENLASKNIHFNLNGMFTVNCPVTEMQKSNENDLPILKNQTNPYISSQFYLFPMGTNDYIEIIMEMIEAANKLNLINPSMTKATGIHGHLKEVLDYYKFVLNEAKTHTFMQVNISVNSPSHK